MAHKQASAPEEISVQSELEFLRRRVAELESEAALRESDERFQALIEASAQIVWTSKWIYFQVRDNGIGIKPEYADHIFRSIPPASERQL